MLWQWFMRVNTGKISNALVALVLAGLLAHGHAAQLRIGTYNLESYLETAIPNRSAKSAESKAKVRESILLLRPDIIALQELGSEGALLELRSSLKNQGLDLGHWMMVYAADTNIHVGLLSSIPFEHVRMHTNDSFLLNGRRFHVSRGFAEIDFRLETGYRFTLFAAHLKSKRAAIEADEAALRFEEAKILREAIDLRLTNDPQANLIVLGDFNDTRDSESIKTILGRGKNGLLDTRPAEWDPEGGRPPRRQQGPRSITWTHFYSKPDIYSRVDYILLSKGMARSWVAIDSFVLKTADWGIASDHRPVLAAFETVGN
jgi:endonuclease/exonuclease/phosphatase family metal-dependent hydrolase